MIVGKTNSVKKELVTVYMLEVIVKDVDKSSSLMDLLWLAIWHVHWQSVIFYGLVS